MMLPAPANDCARRAGRGTIQVRNHDSEGVVHYCQGIVFGARPRNIAKRREFPGTVVVAHYVSFTSHCEEEVDITCGCDQEKREGQGCDVALLVKKSR